MRRVAHNILWRWVAQYIYWEGGPLHFMEIGDPLHFIGGGMAHYIFGLSSNPLHYNGMVGVRGDINSI